MTDKDFGRKPKVGPVSKKGSPKPPPKNRNSVGWISLRAIQPTGPRVVGAGLIKPAHSVHQSNACIENRHSGESQNPVFFPLVPGLCLNAPM